MGVLCTLQIKKNRITGRERSIVIPIYHSFGIDDVGSCVNYLIEEGYWKQKSNSILAPDFDFKGKKEKLIRYIDEGDMVKDLQSIVGDVWDEIEKVCTIKRRRRYE